MKKRKNEKGVMMSNKANHNDVPDFPRCPSEVQEGGQTELLGEMRINTSICPDADGRRIDRQTDPLRDM